MPSEGRDIGTTFLICAEERAEQENMLRERRASGLSASTSHAEDESVHRNGRLQNAAILPVDKCLTVTLPAEVRVT